MKKNMRGYELLVNPNGISTKIGDRDYQIYVGVTAITRTVKGFVIRVTKDGHEVRRIPEKAQGAAETREELLDLIDTMS